MKKLFILSVMLVFCTIMVAQDTLYAYKQVYIKCSHTGLRQATIKAGLGVTDLFPSIWYDKEGKTIIIVVEDSPNGTLKDVNREPKFTSAMEALAMYTDKGWSVHTVAPLQLSNESQVYMYLLRKKKTEVVEKTENLN